MKHFQLNKLLIFVLTIYALCCVLTSCEVEDISGQKFYITNDGRKYMADTTQNSFTMVDNVQMKEKFHIERNYFFNTQEPYYHYFSEFKGGGSVKGTAFAETYTIAYKSILSQYYFRFRIRGSLLNQTTLEVKWCEDRYNFYKNDYEDNNQFEYNFCSKKVTSKIKPKVSFYDSLTISNTTYFDVIEIDYSNIKDKINENTPIRTFFASKVGLIKFIPKDGIIVERIE